MKGAANKAGLCSTVFLEDLLLIDTGTSDSEPPHTNTSSSSPKTRLKLVGEAVSCHPWASVPTGSHLLR